MRSLGLALVLATACCGGEAHARGGGLQPKGPGKPGEAPLALRGAPMRDLPTIASVPIDDETSLVLALGPQFWLKCPRHLQIPTSLAGRGVIYQYMNPRGGSVSMLYAGSVPLVAAQSGDAAKDRAARTAAAFAGTLPAKYTAVEWTVVGGAPELSPASIKVGAKKVAGWRTARYRTRPNDYRGPESEFVGECVLFQPAGTELLAYVALEYKGGGTTLDAAIARMDLKPTRGLHAKGRRVQLNDLRESGDGRYPVRLLAFDMPPGFAPTPALDDIRGEYVFVEERLPAAGGPVDAVLRIQGRPAALSESPAEAAAGILSRLPDGEGAEVEVVDLSVRGHQAHLFSHAAPAEGKEAIAHTAFFVLDDRLLTMTWISRTGAAQAAEDRKLFVSLLRGVEMAVRW